MSSPLPSTPLLSDDAVPPAVGALVCGGVPRRAARVRRPGRPGRSPSLAPTTSPRATRARSPHVGEGQRDGQPITGTAALRGPQVCLTGMGVSMVANKHPRVLCCPAETPEAARNAKSISNANAITLGGTLVSWERVAAMARAWTAQAFAGPCPASGEEPWPDDVADFLRRSLAPGELPACCAALIPEGGPPRGRCPVHAGRHGESSLKPRTASHAACTRGAPLPATA